MTIRGRLFRKNKALLCGRKRGNCKGQLDNAIYFKFSFIENIIEQNTTKRKKYTLFPPLFHPFRIK